MEVMGWKGRLYWFVELVTMLAVVQLMWIGLTLLGLVVFGIGPATAGIFHVMRKRLQGEDDLKTLLKSYWQTYKNEFIDANKIGVTLLAFGYFLVVNFRVASSIGGMHGLVMMTLLITILVLYAVLVINIFPVFAHYELPFSRYFSASVLLSLSFPMQAILSFIGLYGLYRVFLFIPGLLPFFGISLTVLFLAWMADRIFNMKGKMDGTLQAEGK
ncbi:hypothetical protein NCCP2222_35540 [Sporosarcina sp. NCCP-2222]|nr:hypothetical protein NCCP2222_35540 [Sporosarcina sp. NCCP-2222]